MARAWLSLSKSGGSVFFCNVYFEVPTTLTAAEVVSTSGISGFTANSSQSYQFNVLGSGVETVTIPAHSHNSFIINKPASTGQELPMQVAIWHQTTHDGTCLLYTSPSPRDATLSRMPSSA